MQRLNSYMVIARACKNYTPNHNEGECEECKHEYFQYQNIDARAKWEWCGIKKGDHDA